MGLGGSILTRHDGGPREPERLPSSVPVWAVGLVVFGGLFAWGLSAIEGRQVCIVLTGVYSVVLAIGQMVSGWQHEGLLGLLLAMKYPLGLALFDELVSTPRERAWRWVWWSGMTASIALIFMRGWPF